MDMKTKKTIQMFALALTVLLIYAGYISLLDRIMVGTPPEVDDTPEARYTVEKLYDAIRFVESTNGERIYGENGEIGDYQLKKIYVDDVNRIQRLLGYDGEWMSYDDRYDTVKSRNATAIVTSHYANTTWKDKPHTDLQYIETAARSHHRPTDRDNSKTDAYWKKIKKEMKGR